MIIVWASLIKMTKANLINGAIEYIPRKTKEGRPLTVRVPLNAIAQEIVVRYNNCECYTKSPRRTFVGNLYKQVKDPNLVGSLSGHKEGSKAFARYREIDDEMKKELVDLLK